MKAKTETLLWIAVAGIVAYVLYKSITKVKEAAQATGDAIAVPIANAWLSWFLPNPVQVAATIRLPDGRMLEASAIHITQIAGTDTMTFDYLGRRYELLPRTPQGYYGSKVYG